MIYKFNYDDRVIFVGDMHYFLYGITPSSIGKIIRLYEVEQMNYYHVEFREKTIYGVKENELNLAMDKACDECCDLSQAINTLAAKTMEEENMKTEKIISMYFDRCEKQLQEAVASATTKFYDEDSHIYKLRGLIEEIKKITDQYESGLKFIEGLINSFCTEETCWRISNIDNIKANELNNIKEEKEEVLAMISGCETYEQELEILKAYKIVNSDLIMSAPKTYNIEV